MRHFSDKYRENQNRHVIFNKCFSENRVVFKIIWKNLVEPDRRQMTVWCMGVACWITKATDTHSEYVILIVFLRQQVSRKSAPVVGYTYISCLVLPNIEEDRHSATDT